MLSLESTRKTAGFFFGASTPTANTFSGLEPDGLAANWRCRAMACFLILGAAFLHVVYLLSARHLDLAPDEAHYWDWSRHLDWSYYSKGPGVAFLIRAGCWLAGSWSEAWTGNQMAAVRLPAVICGGLLLVSLYILTLQVFGRDDLALGVVVVSLTMPFIALGSTLMTIDSPYCCCWGWALVAGHRAVFRRSTASWIAAGVLVGAGILAKYTMVVWLPSVGLFLLFSPRHRMQLAQPGFWIATFLAGLCCLPILVWNMQHGWVTFRHVGGQAGLSDGGGILWWGPLQYVGIQAAVLFGYWFVVWVGAMVRYRPWQTDDGTRYLWWLSAPMFVMFLGFSLKTNGEPNWPVTAYISGLVLAAGWLAELWSTGSRTRRLWLGANLAGASVLGLVVIGLMHYSELAHPVLASLAGPPREGRPTPLRKFDPTCRLRGWPHLAEEVDKLRAELSALGEEPVLAAGSWSMPGEISFYCEGQPPVYSLGLVEGERHSQYDFWHPNPVDEDAGFLHRTFIFVGDMTPTMRSVFDQVDSTRLVTHEVQGRPVATWSITVCRGYRGVGPLRPVIAARVF